LVNYYEGGDVRLGAVVTVDGDPAVADLARLVERHGKPWRLAGVEDVLELPADGRAELAALAGADQDIVAMRDVRLAPPVRRWPVLICCGMTYAGHRSEMNEGKQRRPSWFIKNHNAVISSGEDIVVPDDYPDMVDFEGEVAVVFGRDCYKVGAANAMEYVGGYTLVNDVTARNWAPGAPLASHDTLAGLIAQQTAKQYPTFCPIGPALLTADEVADPSTLGLTTHLNGTLMQEARLSDLVTSVPELIEAVSRTYRLRAGDVLSTGSPGGTGFGRTPPRFLAPGDTVTVHSPGIGTLRNGVRRAPTTEPEPSASIGTRAAG
jgi:2-keto-4-pentenoate hydratase/2-oxohepta-3-ene-1,7-dioic acid hydratase in catechol pathway